MDLHDLEGQSERCSLSSKYTFTLYRKDNDSMTQQRLFTIAASGALLIVALFGGCSRKAPQAGPAAPEVLVTTVQPRDVPRVLERVATLDGFINANINAQVQGYIISRDYKEGSIVKKGDLLFQIDPRPFEAALAQAKGTLARDQANWAKADADQRRAADLFEKKVISPQRSEEHTSELQSLA